MVFKDPTTDAAGTSPAGTGGSLAGRPLDPKALAEKMDVAPRWCRHLSKDETALIIAALRAYEPHVHKMTLWIGSSRARADERYHRRCIQCGATEYARDLVPVEDAP